MLLKEGDIAPNFKLKDQTGSEHSLSDYNGSWVLVYFYPKDDTPGCTKEACELRDNLPHFDDLDMTILGISTDSVESHKKFASKHKLPFTLLADVDKEVVNLYGVWQPKKFMGREFMGTVRSSFLVDENGNIAKVYEKVKPAVHAKEVLEDVKKLK